MRVYFSWPRFWCGDIQRVGAWSSWESRQAAATRIKLKKRLRRRLSFLLPQDHVVPTPQHHTWLFTERTSSSCILQRQAKLATHRVCGMGDTCLLWRRNGGIWPPVWLTLSAGWPPALPNLKRLKRSSCMVWSPFNIWWLYRWVLVGIPNRML